VPRNLHRQAPAYLPQSSKFVLYGEMAIAGPLARIVALLRPQSSVEIGRIENADVDPGDAHLILCGANWAADLEVLREKGVKEDNMSLLPVPVDDPWSWWEFALKTGDDLFLDHDRVGLGQPDFVNYLIGIGRAGLDDQNMVQLNPNSYGFNSREVIEQSQEAVSIVISHLADERSRQSYRRVLFGDPMVGWQDYISRTFRRSQYFDYIRFDLCQQVLNGGIWLGFEIPLLMAALPDDCIVHNVDPLGDDYLTDYVKPTMVHFADRIVNHRVALADHAGTVTFPVLPDGQASPQFGMSEFEAGEDQEFPCTTVDQFVAENGFAKYGLIKFDLEAGEVAAIPCMQETIARYRPQMAISVYHYVNHMWDIPLALIAVCQDYHFYFDCYSWERWEGILYCIPREIDDGSSQPI
jgi:FkbM family methyltransferase